MRHLLFVMVLLSLSGCAKAPPPPATDARVRHWIEVLHQPDAKMRQEAAFKLGNLGMSDPATVVTALTAALNDADGEVRCAAILAVLKCGPDARQAIPALTQIEKQDADPKVRDYAAKALGRLHNNP